MAARRRATRLDVEVRVDKCEELLCAGLGAGKIEAVMVKEHGITPRQARRYLQQVYRRWREQSTEDAPARREKVIRMAERLFAKALAKEQFSAAAQAVAILARLSGGLLQHDPARAKRLKELGPPPTNTRLVLPYARKLLVFELYEVAQNESLDPDRRLRWIAELAGKMGMIFSRSEIEETAERIEGVLNQQLRNQPSVMMVSSRDIQRPPTARGGAGPRLRPDEVPPRDDGPQGSK